MNVRKFKAIVSGWDNSKDNFKTFRIWVNNCYDYYQKSMDIDYRETERQFVTEEDFIDSEDFSELFYKWKYISYGSITKLYNRMGWEVDESITQTRIQYDEGTDCLYYGLDFMNIYTKIQDTEDDIEFAYAILMLMSNISDKTKLYERYADKVFEGIKECNLQECLKLLDDNREKKVFIAMSFAESMTEARKKIEMAVRNSGYSPILIDVKEHNNQIVPEIYQEIDESTFVVADLTGQRGGVYYEAGYATAKEKPLILSCKRDKKEKPHFDVAQINTIFWEDEEDLYNRLVKRIKTTIIM